jgi:nicotinate-nucleotide--dimethylbenzimidazole phosphoribosyltransferase
LAGPGRWRGRGAGAAGADPAAVKLGAVTPPRRAWHDPRDSLARGSDVTEPLDLDDLASRVEPPDGAAADAARARQLQLIKPPGALGRLEELAAWVAGAQGRCPPADFSRARVVVFAGDHGVAAAGVSAYPQSVTAQMLGAFRSGGAAVNVLAELAGATVRVVDVAVDSDPAPDAGGHRVRRGSGRIDREDALTRAEAEQAIAAGTAIADAEVDGGADLLVTGDMGIANSTPAAVLIAALADAEPVQVIGRGSGVDDAGWMRKVVAIRDALRRARPARRDPVTLLATVGGADFAALTGFLLQAAVRRTPVLLDGVVSAAAAMVARELAPAAVPWWLAGHRSTEPAHWIALDRLGLNPVLDLGVGLGEGTGALLALPLLRAAVRTLSDMATADEAGVAGRVPTEQ